MLVDIVARGVDCTANKIKEADKEYLGHIAIEDVHYDSVSERNQKQD